MKRFALTYSCPYRMFRATAILMALVALTVSAVGRTAPNPFSIEQIMGYPFPNELAASATGARFAWVFNRRGLRNIWAAEGPDFRPRQVTNYTADDGQELTNVALSPDGSYIVYVRGGDHDANWNDVPPNPASLPVAPKMQIWSISFKGGEPKLLAEGDSPVISPKGDRVAFEKDGAIWVAPIDAAVPPRRLFSSRGTSGGPEWSPDGTRLAFVSSRGDHSFIGVFTNDSTPILYLAPSTSRDFSPRWSPDGKRIAFVRRPGAGGVPEPVLAQRLNPWAIWTADATTGEGRVLWKSAETLRGSVPTTWGGTNLHWAALGRIVFLSVMDGWPHLYSISESGGEPLLLTPGNYMAEHIRISPDGREIVFTGNAGEGRDDIDRRHLVKVAVDRAQPVVLTPGQGLEWMPVITGDGRHIAFVSATAERPPLPAVIPAEGGHERLLAEDLLPADFPSAAQLVTPRKVVFTAPDGIEVHAQLFERPEGAAKRPAIIYVHGGPPRQMLLGWNYSDYYSNAYAVNQYLASRGYIVLSVNYRLGIGYGDEFHHPKDAGSRGASEYQDVKAGGEYLRRLPQVDAKRIGIYGGSYGGFLTALALARDSDLFAGGVDLHGVHDWTAERSQAHWLLGKDSYEKPPDAERALETAWRSSPDSSINTWKSPVLLIQGDDDRNVRFSQTVDLAERLRKAGVQFEELVIPDETHDFLRYASWLKADTAIVAFFDKIFGQGTR